MLLVNLNVPDGSANGSILKRISYDKLKRANIVWISFDNPKMGQITR
jgi:ABC-type xylose transport system substrate-binding protein